MLDLLNRYAHGYIAVPVILSFQRRGGFDQIVQSSPMFEQLVQDLSANAGHLRIAIRLLESLGWCDVDGSSRIRLNQAGTAHRLVPGDLSSLYDLPVGEDWWNPPDPAWLVDLTRRSTARWGISDHQLADIVDGAFLVPLFLSLRTADALNDKPLFGFLPRQCRESIEGLFLARDWATRSSVGLELNDVGRNLLDRIPIMGTVSSYRPMLSKMDELLFGDATQVFQRDDQGHETHIDRNLNVLSSGFQHDRYFADLEEVVVTIFNQPPFERQPKYIADMGCGDGTLLKRLYEKIRDTSSRGKVLDRFPLTLIGVDYNVASLEATTRTLDGLPRLIVQGDIVDPQRLLNDLKERGIADPENILHVRSFLDHDRPFRMPLDEKALSCTAAIPYSGVYTRTDGRPLESATVIQSLVEHLRRWSAITNRFGLIALEVHSLPPRVVRKFLDECENIHYDAFHGFSGQLLVEPDVFLMAAAEAGLFPDPRFLHRYPKLLPFTRITLNRFQPRPYIVRYVRQGDITALTRLEAECWDEAMRASADRLAMRIAKYPEGQFVLETDEGVVGVLYTQRIADPIRLETSRDDDVEALFDRSGSCAQLIAVNITPRLQQRGLGDQLLEFVLQVLSVKGDVENAFGVTRCRDFPRQRVPMEEYVRLRGDDDAPLDPMLRFHDFHGARIIKLVPGYRPADTDNGGCGVLIKYDLRRRQSKRTAEPQPASMPVTTTPHNEVASFVTATIQEILGEDADHFSPTETLLDLGLDSMSMLELRTVLGHHFHRELPSTFLFEYDTAEAIMKHFSR